MSFLVQRSLARRASLVELGRYRYTVTAWVDHFLSWRTSSGGASIRRTSLAALVGAELIEEAANRRGRWASTCSTCRRSIRSAATPQGPQQRARPPQPGRRRQPVGDRRAEGGHKAVHPELGTLEDFRRLVARARALGIEIALDIAFQCAPDHPYVREHPEWFRKRPDGTSSTPRTRRRSTRTSTRSTSSPRTGARCGRSCASVFDFWIEQGVRSSASTTRTPSRSRSGSGLIGEVQARAPRGDLPVRGVHPARR
jgi:hypothetical protein